MATQEELLKIYPKEQIALNPGLLNPSYTIPSSPGTDYSATPPTTNPTPTGINATIPETLPADFMKQLDVSRQKIRTLQEQVDQASIQKAQLDAANLAKEQQIRQSGSLQPFVEGDINKARDLLAIQQQYLASNILPTELKLNRAQEEQKNLIDVFKLTRPDTQVITETDNTGKTTATVIDKNTGKVLNKQDLGAIGKMTQTPTEKQTMDTLFNLIQTYPDAKIQSTDSLDVATAKATGSQSFQTKNTYIRGLVDPVNGGITYWNTRDRTIVGSVSGKSVAAGNGIITPTKDVPVEIPSIIKPAVETALGLQYIDMGKITTGQTPLAQRVATANSLPLLTKGDSDEVQKAVATYKAANALLQTIGQKADVLITATRPTEVVAQAIRLNAGALFRTNPDAKIFQDTIKSFSSLLTRAAGEKGVLTNMDVQRIINALPNWTDTVDIKNGKRNSLDQLFFSQVQSAVDAYITNSSSKPTASIQLNKSSADILSKYGIK